jgi:hypothetical protein
MQSRSRLLSLLIASFVSSSNPIAARAEADAIALRIRVHVVHVGGEPVVARAFIEAQLARANAIFGPYGVRFVPDPAPPPLPEQHAALESRADRDALGAYARPGAIDCFVVRSLRDVDEPPRMRRGVHWHARGHAGAHFVVLSSIAGPDVLAHELGHYLGNPKHSETPGNLLSYERGEQPLPVLDRAQVRRMRAALASYLRSGELIPATASE